MEFKLENLHVDIEALRVKVSVLEQLIEEKHFRERSG